LRGQPELCDGLGGRRGLYQEEGLQGESLVHLYLHDRLYIGYNKHFVPIVAKY